MNRKNKTGGTGHTLYEKTILVFAFFLCAVILLIVLTACKNGLFGNSAYGTVRIDLGAAADRGSSQESGGSISSRAIPDTVTSFVLTVEGEGMDTIEQTFTGTDIELDVPAGPGRTFTLTAFGPDDIKLYSGSAVADVEGGGDTTITIILQLLSGDAFITAFDLLINGNESDGTYGIINEDLGAVLGVVPLGTTLTELIPVAEVSEGATIDIEEGATIDFSGGTGITATVTAANGTTKEYQINITGDKLIVLDANYYLNPGIGGGRIVQIDDFSAAGWLERNGTTLGVAQTDFKPYDIDFDIYGRIYIANNATAGGFLRLDSFTDTTPEWLFTGEQIASLAVDRVNNLVYFISWTGSGTFTDNTLKRCDYEGQNLKEYTGHVFDHADPSYAGLTVDDEGLVYLSRMDGGTTGYIVKIDPSGSGTEVDAVDISPIRPWDITFKDNVLYVSDSDNGNEKVLSYKKDLVPTGVEMPITNVPANSDNETWPTRFIAVLNKKINLIDDGEEADQKNRILAFDDLTGIDDTMWSEVTGDYFQFFHNSGSG